MNLFFDPVFKPLNLKFFNDNFKNKYYVKPGTQVSNIFTDYKKEKVLNKLSYFTR